MSINITTFIDTLLGLASTIFNSLIPIFGVVIAISLGLGLMFLVYNLIKELFPRLGNK